MVILNYRNTLTSILYSSLDTGFVEEPQCAHVAMNVSPVHMKATKRGASGLGITSEGHVKNQVAWL